MNQQPKKNDGTTDWGSGVGKGGRRFATEKVGKKKHGSVHQLCVIIATPGCVKEMTDCLVFVVFF
jgi:hypothetical protein